MRISPYFKDLFSLYDAEIDDLSTDSSGANVLHAGLDQKRRQLSLLLPMMAFSPEMVAAAFHGAFRFNVFRVMEDTVAAHDHMQPSWTSLAPSLTLADWAEPLVRTVLAAEGGAAFLVQTAGLEFLMHHLEREQEPASTDVPPDEDDLAQAGSEWMAEQGFDRLT